VAGNFAANMNAMGGQHVRPALHASAAEHLVHQVQQAQLPEAWGVDKDPMARVCCNALLHAYADAKQWSRGLALLTSMVQCAPPLPRVVRFAHLLFCVLANFAADEHSGRTSNICCPSCGAHLLQV
jgi:pentatricopeptide repeat protein